jgi:cell wall-associated NlpC family hydrolase
MRVADILRTLANNLEHAEGGAPDPRIQNPAELIDVAVVANAEKASPNGTTASGNDREPEELFLPPLQQKQELLKKAVGVENIYDDGTASDQEEQQDDMSAEREDIVDRIKQLSGVPTAAIQELSNDEVFDD